MSVPAFANGGMNVTGLRLVDLTGPAVKSYLHGWSAAQRRVNAGASHSNVIQVHATSVVIIIIIIVVVVLVVWWCVVESTPEYTSPHLTPFSTFLFSMPSSGSVV